MRNYILDYYQQIKDGSIIVGKMVLAAYEYVVNGLERKDFRYSPKRASHAIRWIEKNCFHTEGDLACKRIKLELWQKAMLSVMFGITDDKGKRQFREFFLVVGRKNGKTLLAACIAKYIWKTGGFGTRVYNIAPKLDQASLVYDSVWNMVLIDPDYQERKAAIESLRSESHGKVDDSELEKHRQTDLYISALNSTVKKIAFSAKKSDGFNPSLTICDEVSSWEGDAGLKQYEVLKSGMGARSESFLLACTTSGYVNDSIYDELMKRSTRFLLGESKEKRLFPLLYLIDDINSWDDINELSKSNPNLGVSVSVDYMLEEIAIAEQSLSKKAEFMTKYCNIKQNSSVAWLDAQVVNKATGERLDLNDFRSSYSIAGLDLSQAVDLTAAVCIIQRGEDLYVFAHFWLPSEKIEEATQRDGLPYQMYIQRGFLTPSGENFIDYHDCFDWFKMLVEEYEILPLMVGYDRYSAQYLIQDLKSYGFRCDDVYQGDNLWGIIQETEGLLKDGRIHIGDNDLLKVHLLNSAIKMNTERGRGKLVKISPSDHIDGCAALIDAMCCRQKWWPEMGSQLQN